MGIIITGGIVLVVCFTGSFIAGMHLGLEKQDRQASAIDFQNYIHGVHGGIFDITPKQNTKEEV